MSTSLAPRALFAGIFILALAAPREPALPEPEWLTKADFDHLEPAAVRDGAGRTWAVSLRWRPGASDVVALVLGADERVETTVEEGEDLPARPALAPLRDGVFCAWERGERGARQLVGRTLRLVDGRVRRGELEVLARGAAQTPRLARTGPDRLELVFVDAGGALRRVQHATRQDGVWSEPADLAPDAGDVYAPRCAAAPDGALHVVYDSWDGTSFDVHHLRVLDGEVTARALVAGGPAHQAYPDVCVAPDGTAWITWEESPRFGTGGPLRVVRTPGLAALTSAGQTDASASLRAALPEGETAHLPAIGWSGAGPVLLWRTPEVIRLKRVTTTLWQVRAARFDAEGAARVEALSGLEGGPETFASPLPGEEGLRWVVAADERARLGRQNKWDDPEEGPARLALVAPAPSSGAPGGESRPAVAPPAAAPSSPSPPLLLGDLHRHTTQSRCSAWQDGILLDQIRYARGPGGLAFLAVTDHVQHMRPCSLWRTARDADRHDAPGRLAVLPALEKVVTGYGHHNLVWSDAAPLRAAADTWISTASALPRIPEAPVISIPHMMGSDENEFRWHWFAPGEHKLLEVYQGLRGSYEGRRAPYQAGDFRHSDFSIAQGIASQRRFGLVAASDHGSSAGAFATLRAERIDRELVFEELRARRTTASTAPCELLVQIGELTAGEMGPVPAGAPLVARVLGGGPVASLEVFKNGEPWRVLRGEGEEELWALTCHLHETDSDPRLSAEVRGASLLEALPRAPDSGDLRVERDGDRLLLRGGHRRADAVLRMTPAPDGDGELVVRHGENEQTVRLRDVPLGGCVYVYGPPPVDQLWRIGPPLGEEQVEVTFTDEERQRGDAYHVRVTFVNGQLAWSSPLRVARITKEGR